MLIMTGGDVAGGSTGTKFSSDLLPAHGMSVEPYLGGMDHGFSIAAIHYRLIGSHMHERYRIIPSSHLALRGAAVLNARNLEESWLALGCKTDIHVHVMHEPNLATL